MTIVQWLLIGRIFRPYAAGDERPLVANGAPCDHRQPGSSTSPLAAIAGAVLFWRRSGGVVGS
jgi:hypothetical protein